MKKNILSVIIITILAASCTTAIKHTEENQTMKKIHSPIPVNKMVMYEIFVRNFSKEGNLKGVTAKLSDLKLIGINTLWLMPIQPTGIEKHKGTYGSPYAIMNYTEVHPDYGTKADFKQLVDSCHALGMNIIIDHVANHTSWDNPWITKHPDWYVHDSLGNIIPSVPDWTDIADLNYDNKEMRAEMIRSLEYWVNEFDIDGFRCDVAEMVPNDFWKDAIDSLRKIKNVVMLAEGADPKLYDAGFNITYGWDYYHNLKQVFKGDEPVTKLADVIAIEQKKYSSVARQIRFITNHDENSWDNIPNELFGNLEGTKAAYTIMCCTPGVPFVYNGQEVGYPTKINLFEKFEIDYAANAELKKFYTDILNLYNSSEVLQKGEMEWIDLRSKDAASFIRKLGSETILVIANVRGKEIKFNKCSDITSTSKLLLGENISADPMQTLKPYGFQIIKL